MSNELTIFLHHPLWYVILLIIILDILLATHYFLFEWYETGYITTRAPPSWMLKIDPLKYWRCWEIHIFTSKMSHFQFINANAKPGTRQIFQHGLPLLKTVLCHNAIYGLQLLRTLTYRRVRGLVGRSVAVGHVLSGTSQVRDPTSTRDFLFRIFSVYWRSST